MTENLYGSYKLLFNTDADPVCAFAPGRMNIIGEHTDYNGGNVLPAAISFGTYALGSKREDGLIRVSSLNFPEDGLITFRVDDLDYKQEDGWANYPKGMFRYLHEAGHILPGGVDILFYGDIPNGAGLSSSASIELATGVLLSSLFNLDVERKDLVLIGQQVENEFLGISSGIMDQFAVGMGKANHAIRLNCESLEYEYAPLMLDGYSFIIMNTNKKRTLVSSSYNERRKQCEAALKQLNKESNVSYLCQLTPKQFEASKHLIGDPIQRKRAKHVIYEHARTAEAVKRLASGDLSGFGQLMNESHLSLEHEYEVTGVELDTIVHTAWKQQGVLGARMTGAGFGGCAIAIVKNEDVVAFIENTKKVYKEVIGYDASLYQVTIGDGAYVCNKKTMIKK
ncbi:galactokinase [Bacillus sp. JCM 19041]|uniref:galactokinase n=1 Tax=Bacillus sp. JCM 19041 TaxID=1460637 RepID=UPI0006D188A7